VASHPREPQSADGRRWPSRLLGFGCRIVLAAVFLMAAISKITDLCGFEDQILSRSALPDLVGLLVVKILPWLELTCGVCLALGYAVREAAACCSFLLVLFLIATFRDPVEADCGCFLFPTLAPPGWSWWLPARNGLLLCCGLYVAARKE
jgi:uncharacterized membrane protein YphA (DoxX/SURF4 family)